MASNKVNKYLNQYQERNYAPKTRKIQKGDLAKYCYRGQSGKATEASDCHSIQQSRQEQEKVDLLTLDLLELKAKDVEWYGKTVLVTEQCVYIGDDDEETGIQCASRRIAGCEGQGQESEPVTSSQTKGVRGHGESRAQEEIQLRQEDEIVYEERREVQDSQSLKERRQGISSADQRRSKTEERIKSTEEEGLSYGQSEAGLGSPIQSCGEASCQVGSGESSSGSSSCRNEKVRQRKDGKASGKRKKGGEEVDPIPS